MQSLKYEFNLLTPATSQPRERWKPRWRVQCRKRALNLGFNSERRRFFSLLVVRGPLSETL